MPRTKIQSAARQYQMKIVSWILLVVALFAFPAFGQNGWQAADPSGIHSAVPRNVLHPDRWETGLLQTHDCALPCLVALDDRLSALHLRYKWAQLNPERGVYDFEDLRQVLNVAQTAGKKVTLIVMAGKYTPGWVFGSGATALSLTTEVSDNYSQPYIPLPWDPVFLNAYGAMIDALAGFLRQTPDLYRTVVMVKNGAVVVHSGEMRLMPPKAFETSRGPKKSAEALRTEICREWARSGYAEDKILDSVRTTNARIATAFPDQYLGIAFVGGSNRFPTVDSSGTCSYPAKNKTMNRIIKQTVETYGPRAIINNTVFSNDNGIPPILEWTLQNGGRVGAQLNRQSVGCHERENGFCSDTDLRDTIQMGVSAGFTFIEVHDGNIHRNQITLREANRILGN